MEVKHGVRVRVVSLYSDGVGNAGFPQTLRRQRLVRRRRFLVVSTVAAILVRRSSAAQELGHGSGKLSYVRKPLRKLSRTVRRGVAVLPSSRT